MFGTIVNAVAILAGGLVGLMLRGGIKEKYKTIITQGVALAVLFLGISSTVGKLLLPDANPVLFILCLVVGGILGEWIGIEARLEKLGNWLQGRVRVKKEYGSVSTGFVAASLLFCVGTMAILGPLESGLENQHGILLAKSTLDGITSVVMASSLGIGVVFSAGSVFLYQGLITLLAFWISPLLTADMLRELSIVGGILISGIGLNMLGLTKIKIGNFLPSVFLPIAYYLVLEAFK